MMRVLTTTLISTFAAAMPYYEDEEGALYVDFSLEGVNLNVKMTYEFNHDYYGFPLQGVSTFQNKIWITDDTEAVTPSELDLESEASTGTYATAIYGTYDFWNNLAVFEESCNAVDGFDGSNGCGWSIADTEWTDSKFEQTYQIPLSNYFTIDPSNIRFVAGYHATDIGELNEYWKPF